MRTYVHSVVALLLCIGPPLWGQNHVEAGVFVDYVGISQTSTDNYGIGARFGYSILRNVMVEGELAYDYGINFQESFRNVESGNISAIQKTSIGVTQGLIGPTIHPARGHLRPFATLKAGFIDFRLSPSLIPYSNFASTALGLRTSSVSASIYPAVGAEASLGPLGLRLEAGDAIYFNNGAHNNLRITFGPILRF